MRNSLSGAQKAAHEREPAQAQLGPLLATKLLRQLQRSKCIPRMPSYHCIV